MYQDKNNVIMKVNIFKSENFKIRKWSGGTTTELFIWPENSDFSQQNFDFRLSSASVETEESEFTAFPDYMRHLSILEGEIKIMHKDKYEKILKPNDSDTFSGKWNTKSYGKAIDFNLILKPEFKAEMECFSLQKDEIYVLHSKPEFRFFFLFLFKGEILMEDSENLKLSLCDYTLAEFQSDIDIKINAKALKKSNCVVVKIY